MKSITALRSFLCLFLVLSVAPAVEAIRAATPQLSVSPTLYLPMLSAGNTALPMPIVFVSNSDNDYGIYLAQPGVASYQLLTAESASEPALSPDRSKLAFSSGRTGNQEIYLLDMASRQLQRLTNTSGIDDQPAWSPDGSQIAYTSVYNGRVELYVMQADGTEQRLVTSDSINIEDPTWSPDGTSIAFVSPRIADLGTSPANQPRYLMHIFSIRLDGSDLTQLTFDSVGSGSFSPDWSASTGKIVFASFRSPANPTDQSEIYVMNGDGSEQVRLTNNTFDDNRPNWSPDGRWIAFDSTQYGSYDIFIMAADGTQTTRLTAPPANDAWADW